MQQEASVRGFEIDFGLHMWKSVEELGAQEGKHTIAFNLHGEHNGGMKLVESLKKISRRCFVWHNGRCVINKSPVVCGHLAFLLQSFFNASQTH